MKTGYLKIGLCFFFLLGAVTMVHAQKTNDFGNPTLTHFFNPEKTRSISFSGYTEIWARYAELNPGSLVNGEQVNSISDLSLRRVRIKMAYQPTEKLTFILQGGLTNVNVAAKTNPGFELLDAYAEYKFNNVISAGAGRSTWRGLSRFTTGPLNTLLYDLPSYATANAGISDEVVREFSIYAKGQIGRLDYRLVIADPYTNVSADPQFNVANFSKTHPNKDYSGYFKYEFFESENNSSPFHSGTYNGKKKVLALGAGFEYMHNALWHLDGAGTTVHDDEKSFAVDLFYDTPINKERGTSFSAYAMAMNNDYGPNYTRYSGVSNPASGVVAVSASLNGAGNASPVIGTGNTYYLQIGGTLPYFNKEKNTLQLQPAGSITLSDLDGLHDKALTYDAGISLLMNGMSSRFTFDAQNRPIYTLNSAGQATVSDRKWQFVLKYRIDFN
ncbi:hypothetical protein R1T16_07285 [Flavobacterium sp. DG1-102-2]|uniref:hypothetical protein n=1 Tax=Flavobacterium sp. DG1-102-2 TaxID=3081663 RepID=UPI00294A5911|nr:hypothetical protein [Flavobacterium sp. DG1-102-2]MDV6168223.1 hypothetical protein [Flavobacterium sp. DG1-102-2]